MAVCKRIALWFIVPFLFLPAGQLVTIKKIQLPPTVEKLLRDTSNPVSAKRLFDGLSGKRQQSSLLAAATSRLRLNAQKVAAG